MVKASGSVANLAETHRTAAALAGPAASPTPAGPRTARPRTRTPTRTSERARALRRRPQRHNRELRRPARELEAEGIVFRSETDTEVVAHLLEKYYDGDLKRAVMRTAARLEGSYVLGVLCAKEPGRLFCVKEAGPLILGLGVGENYFASDVTALVSRTKNVIYMDDGELAELTPEQVTVYDRTGREIAKTVSHVVWDVEAAEKGGYEHFMMKEIMEQPRAVKNTVEPRIRGGR